MNDLISRQAAVKALQDKVFHNLSDEFYGTMQVLDELPPVNAEPVRHGHWIVADDGVTRCSICYGASDYERSFCGDCGAKMDGGK